jgi:hypothetical protein
MRLSYSPAAQIFLFLVQWTDCNLAGALGLLRILIYLVRSFPRYSFQFACYRIVCVFVSMPLLCALPFSLPGYLSIWFVYCDCSSLHHLQKCSNNITTSCWGVTVWWFVQTYADGKTTMSVQERKASIGEFYGEWYSEKVKLFELFSQTLKFWWNHMLSL